MMSAMKDTQLSKSDVDGTLLTFMWGLHSNTFRIAYWFLAFLLNDREIFDRVKEEIDTELRDHYGGDLNRAVSSPSSSLDKHFPLISSGIKETMRLVVLLNSLREADTDTEIRTSAGPLQIRKGDILMPNVNAVHMDDNTYEDAKTFRLDRFVGDEKSKQTHLGFGGGTHLVSLVSVSPLQPLELNVSAVQRTIFRRPRYQDVDHPLCQVVGSTAHGRLRKTNCW